MDCGKRFEVLQQLQETKKPLCTKKCQKNLMKLDELNSKFTNIQILEVQEIQENIKIGEQYKTIKCYVFNQMCKRFSPGQNIASTGILGVQEMSKSPAVNYYIHTYTIIYI